MNLPFFVSINELVGVDMYSLPRCFEEMGLTLIGDLIVPCASWHITFFNAVEPLIVYILFL